MSFIPVDVKAMKDGAAGLNKYLVNNSDFAKGRRENRASPTLWNAGFICRGKSHGNPPRFWDFGDLLCSETPGNGFKPASRIKPALE